MGWGLAKSIRQVTIRKLYVAGSFNPEPTATASHPNAVAVGFGLNEEGDVALNNGCRRPAGMTDGPWLSRDLGRLWLLAAE
jgi:hypothetical protein